MIIGFLLFLLIGLYYSKSTRFYLLISTIAIVFRYLLYHFKELTGSTIFQNIHSDQSYVSSVGDYILNVTLALFLLIPLAQMRKKQHSLSPWVAKGLSLLNGIVISGLFIHFALVCKGYILDSTYYIDIGSILLFDTSSILLVSAMLLHQFLIALYSVYSFNYLKANSSSPTQLIYSLIGGLLILILSTPFIAFNQVILGGFIIAYLIMMDLFIDSSRKGVVWLIWWMVIHSLLITTLTYYFGIQKEKISKSQYLSERYTLPSQNNIDAAITLKDSILESSSMSVIGSIPYPSKLENKDILTFLEENHFRNGNWKISHTYLLDKDLESLIKDSDKDSYVLNSELLVSSHLSGNLYFNHISSSFLILDTIYNTFNTGAPLVLGISINESYNTGSKSDLDPILLVNNGQIVYPEITYFSSNTISEIVQSNEDFSMEGFNFTVFNISDSTSIISYRTRTGLIKPMSLFSYLFTLGGILIVIIGFFNTRFPFIPEPIRLKIDHKTSLRNKLQTGFIAMLIFSFIIIGLLTAIYFRNVLQGNEKTVSNTQWINIINKVRNEAYLASDTEAAIIKIQNKLNEFSEYYDHSMSIYNNNGELTYSTDQNTLETVDRLPWTVFKDLERSKSIQIDGEVEPFISYIPLFYEGQDPFAYLSIEDPAPRNGYQSIYDFLGTLLNVYVFLFLLAGAIGIFLSNSITRPLSILATKLKDFKLGRKNEPLVWDGNDEIGTLISDYNNLIHQVQESADIIARTERDTAWREMAKQVAHEIKNPLTPMKLSLQYLQKAIQADHIDPKPMIERVSATLIEQIDNLSNIANEFSNFAKMPKSNNEKVILNELVEAVHDLFRKRDDMDISLAEPITDLYVFADRNQLVRILNNLVKNAIQAIPNERRGKIDISLYERDQKAVVEVKDNGVGIPDHMKSKVFTPNFTTKSSGTGLGLAISANIIEGFNGKIYFDTIEGKGTRFYVEIPLMRIIDQPSDVERVSLD